MKPGLVIHQSDGVLVQTNEAGVLTIEISGAKQYVELDRLLHRGLNTWDMAPQWMIDIADATNADLFGGGT